MASTPQDRLTFTLGTGRVARLAAGGRDLWLAIGVGLILALLFVPIPPLLLDVGLAMSIALAVVVLMTALFIETPVQLSAFPTILLISTLLRLGLNIASTRLILSQGHEGTHAAGGVIEAFGRFLMGGSTAVGLTLFAILVVVNFVVITKGAGRIAEVSARFSLDALPGKQMAIDADLSAGLIDERTARARREAVEAESGFYGAMDGASKFVRGDAVAGLIITAINIIMGILLGLLVHDLTLADGFKTYTLLTVGDGLVSQIPALIISAAAGLVISKGAVRGRAQTALGTQLARFPSAPGAAAAVLGLMSLMPGIPFLPFAMLAAACAFAAHRLARRAPELPEAPVEPGVALAPAPDAPSPILDPVRIELGYALVPIVDNPIGEPRLDDQVKALRQHFAAKFGFPLPKVRIVDNLSLRPGEYQILLREVVAGTGELRHDRLLAFAASSESPPIPGEPAREPVFGLPALWIDRTLRDEARFAGMTVVDAAAVVTTHLTEIIRLNLAELFGYRETQELLALLPSDIARLMNDLVPARISHSTVQRVFQNLLAEGVSIRDVVLIAESIAEASAWSSSAIVISEHVRGKLARQISAQLAINGQINAITLTPEWDRQVTDSLVGEAGDRTLALAPSRMQELVASLRRSIEEAVESGANPCLVVSPQLRLAMRHIVDRASPSTPVLSTSEIHQQFRLCMVGLV